MRLRSVFGSLGFQLGLAMSVLIIATGVLVVWQVDGILRENEETRFSEDLLRTRNQLARRIEDDRELAVTGASVLADQPVIREAVATNNVNLILQVATDYYQRTGTTLQGTPGLQVYDADGNLLVRAHDPLRGRQLAPPPDVRRVLATETAMGVLRDDELLGVSISGIAPVLDAEGRLVGAVEALTALTRPFLQAQERLLETNVALLTSDGVLFASGNGELVPDSVDPQQLDQVATDGTGILTLGGDRYLSTLYELEDTEGAPLATMYLGIQEDVVLEGVDSVRMRAIVATGIGTAVALTFGILLAFITVRPVSDLVAAARRIQANDLDTPVNTRGPAEVLHLADALDDLRLAFRQTRDAMLSVNRDLATRFDASSASLSELSQELTVMHGILAALGGSAPGGLHSVTDEVSQLPWVEGAAIALATEEGRLSLAAASNLSPEAVAALLATVEAGVHGQRLEGGIAVTETSALPETASLPEVGVGGFAAQPMLEPDGVTGVLLVTATRSLALTASRTELLRSVSLEVATMLERTELAGEVEENRRIAESVLREMSDGVLVIDHTNHCRVANPAAARMLGRSRLELLNRPAEAILPLGREGLETIRRRATRLDDGPVAPLVAEVDGRSIAISAGPFVDADPERAGMTILMRDLSAEAEAERVKQDFVSMVGHELRTPLTLIRTTIDLLNEGDAGTLNPTQERIVEVLNANADRLMMLINDLLDMSAIDSGRMQITPEPIDLAALARDAVSEAQPNAVAKQHQLRLVVPEQAPAWADRRRISQVLANLISNAIKYTPPGGVIEVRVELADPWVRISVSDNGIGIPPEEQDQLFEKFYRTTQGRRTTGGTGLGLAIARSLVEMHGGRIWAESDGQTGSRFTFTLRSRRI